MSSKLGFFLLQELHDDDDVVGLDFLQKPTSSDLPKHQDSSSSSSSTSPDHETDDHLDQQKPYLDSSSSDRKRKKHPPLLGEFEVEGDDDEGFRTPTSSEHRIPVPATCPPAPRKPNPKQSLLSANVMKMNGTRIVRCRRVLLFDDIDEDLESIFFPRTPDLQRNNIKRAKKDEDQ